MSLEFDVVNKDTLEKRVWTYPEDEVPEGAWFLESVRPADVRWIGVNSDLRFLMADDLPETVYALKRWLDWWTDAPYQLRKGFIYLYNERRFTRPGACEYASRVYFLDVGRKDNFESVGRYLVQYLGLETCFQKPDVAFKNFDYDNFARKYSQQLGIDFCKSFNSWVRLDELCWYEDQIRDLSGGY